MNNKLFGKKLLAASIAATVMLASAGCGKGGESQDSQQAAEMEQAATDGYVYVPQYISLDSDEYFYNMQIWDQKMYYCMYQWDEESQTGRETYYCRDLAEGGEAQELSFVNLAENISVNKLLFDKDGNMIFLLVDYSSENLSPEGYPMPEYFLLKLDSQGNELFNQNITETLTAEDSEVYIQNAAVDGENHIYAAGDQTIFLFDENGVPQGSIPVNSWINSMGTDKNGKVYITIWGDNGMVLEELDYAAKATGATYNGFPSGNNNGSLITGTEHDFLINDGTRLVGYDLDTQTTEEILKWLDCDINGQYVEYATQMEDGRIMAVIRDWSGETTVTEMAYLTKTERSAVAQKEVITLGTLYDNMALQSSAVKFNKSNEQYRISIVTYMDQSSYTENSYNDGITAFNNAVTSGNGPDIIDLSYGVSITTLMDKGLLEDLSPWLDGSQVLKREDFIPNILDAYTINGTLVSIPSSFSVQTVMGRTSQVGSKMGWTLDDMIALLDENPDSTPFEYATKSSVLTYCMMYNQSAFIDWENGTCNFDSDEFKKVLEYANRFPLEYNYDEDRPSTPALIANGEVLLNDVGIYDLDDFSVQLEMFGGDPVTCIGYPTVDGTPGNILSVSESYGISQSSSHKEGAWAFLEFLLSQDNNGNFYYFGFSTKQAELDETLESATKVQYVLDENGEPYLDENGEPVEQGHGSWSFSDGTTISGRTLTEEEVDMIREVINTARPVSNNDDQIMSIITEEVEGYFNGQKSVDEVVNVIQSRVQLYISENY